MKRLTAFMLSLLLVVAIFSGCTAASTADGRLSIVCTVYPVYDWLRNICGDSADITLLGANGSDIHSYQPTAADIAAIANADMTVVIGGLSDNWVSDAIRQSSSGDKFSLLEAVKPERLLAGGEHDHEGEHAEQEYDEHVWLSPILAQKICGDLCKKIVSLDPKNAEKYNANCEKYLLELSALDKEYASTLSNAENKALVFADRYPFRYLAHAYGLSCHAAYDGCSAETSADFSTVKRLAGVIDQYGLSSVIIIDGSSDSLARSVIDASENKSCDVLSVDSMQSTTAAELSSGEDYIAVMRKNLVVIKTALER